MTYQQGETWRFQVREPKADRVFLVRYTRQGMSVWTAMKRVQPGVWEVMLHLRAGQYHFGYFTCEGVAYFNGGTYGLAAQRLSDVDARVEVAPLPRPWGKDDGNADIDDVATGMNAV